MTELIVDDATTETPDTEPTIIYQGYLSTVDEVIEHVRAADTLGLGFRVESYMVSTTDEDTQQGEFEFTLLGDLPVRRENHD